MLHEGGSAPDFAVNLDELERVVLDEISSYRYEVSDGALGRPLSSEKVELHLAEMRAALVKPEWRLVDRSNTGAVARGLAQPRRCALVAEDDTFQLYYDPLEGEYALATGEPPATIGVEGDAVGCWMAR
ncbi:MAG TPA: hypothetical protein VIE18_07040 [Gaiellaceae bacterium]